MYWENFMPENGIKTKNPAYPTKLFYKLILDQSYEKTSNVD